MRRALTILLLLVLGGLTLAGQYVAGAYIVELAAEPVAAVAKQSSRQAGEDRRARIRAEQQNFRQAAEAVGARVVESVENVANALMVRIPDEQAAVLESLPGVVRVYPVREARAELDRAAVFHKVPDAWIEAGGRENAGKGVKIGIVDTGIDREHPAFQDPSLSAPEGYPILGRESFRPFANGKIIVARSYEDLLNTSSNPSPRDADGHGTGVAMAAAGVTVAGRTATITGVAPKAFLGIYKALDGEGRGSEETILKAIDDAVADRMDVLNLSLGLSLAPPLDRDLLSAAIERATAAGVIVVKSAGNLGPGPGSISSPGSAPSGITVGANANAREFAFPEVMMEGAEPIEAVASDASEDKPPIEGPLQDIASLDPSGLLCSAVEKGSLQGKIALILRGECLFETKLVNARDAGAVAAIVYTDAARPDPGIMATGQAGLPAVMIGHTDGLALKKRLEANPALVVKIRFMREAVDADPYRLAPFSSGGPTPELAIKPDLVAAGTWIYTASNDSSFMLINGTSFSAPLVSGAAAVLKATRPGLPVDHYRSLLINSAGVFGKDGEPAQSVLQTGAGVLDLLAALRSPVVADPVSVSFGAGGGSPSLQRQLRIHNTGLQADTFTVTPRPQGASPAPQLSANTLRLGPGESAAVELTLAASNLPAGEHQGFLIVRGTTSEVEARIPYWYGVTGGEPRYLHTVASGSAGSNRSIFIRVADAARVAMKDFKPEVTAVTEDAAVTSVDSADEFYPGFWRARVRLGAGTRSVFRVQAGSVTRTVTISRED